MKNDQQHTEPNVSSSSTFAGDNQMLTVMARVYVKPGSEEQVKKELLNLVPITRQEPGCIQYDMHVNIDLNTLEINPRMYLFYENWRSRQDWDLHMKMPYLKTWFDMAPTVTEKIELTIWKMYQSNTNPTFRGGKAPDPKEKFSLTAFVYNKPGFEDKAHKEMQALIPYTHLEPGCVNYNMHINLDMDTMAPNPLKVLFYENWYNYKVWKIDHMKSDYLVRWFDMAPKVTDKMELLGWHQMYFSEEYKPVKWTK
jgi:quinol monooxygenase YgiN